MRHNSLSAEISWDQIFDVYGDDTDLVLAGAAKGSVASFGASFTATIAASVTTATSSRAAGALKYVHNPSLAGSRLLAALWMLCTAAGRLLHVL